ncbi:HIT family protein [Catenovulum sp. SM1970]|uniref:HIT family protein n=1 Tax=Marinifaba aquimaris TaxID=2741323 RepID=UPI001574381A|nr:HIT family protein [Marinifaba aquimaris]NTS76560.1 HIT family protein [Marinifaba aquimaris]
MTEFELDTRLQADCFEICELKLSKLLLLDNGKLPWLILVPKVAGATELIDLSAEQQTELLAEVNQASNILNDLYQPDKLNVAAIGNVVSQLHVHVIGRYKNDPVWPSPVWGNLADEPYHEEALQKRLTELKQAFTD